ncbi:integrase catalytic subunit [Glaciecola sp. KUL10]|nr:integrase catalytic subunit [Glaciecola sp. KUL10]
MLSVNALVERFFGSLKYDWLFKVPQLASEFTKNDVAGDMRYYNMIRFNSANVDQSPINYENSGWRVSDWT